MLSNIFPNHDWSFHLCISEKSMFGQAGNLHFGVWKVALVVGLLATVVAAAAIIGIRKGQHGVPLEGWEDELGA